MDCITKRACIRLNLCVLDEVRQTSWHAAEAVDRPQTYQPSNVSQLGGFHCVSRRLGRRDASPIPVRIRHRECAIFAARIRGGGVLNTRKWKTWMQGSHFQNNIGRSPCVNLWSQRLISADMNFGYFETAFGLSELLVPAQKYGIKLQHELGHAYFYQRYVS